MKKKGALIVVSGPSGVGKGTICKELLKEYENVEISVSATTRSPRDGEVHGVNYFFTKKEDFEKSIENDDFLEYAKVYENYYGTPKEFVLSKINEGKNVLLEIDIQGALQVKEKYPEGVFVFILPPSLKELKDRIVKRGSETEESLKLRFSKAYEEICLMKEYDYYIMNDEVKNAVERLESIIDSQSQKIDGNLEYLLNLYKEEI